MSSTSAQIDEAKKLAAKVEAGEQISPAHNTGGASASQLTAITPQQPGIEIDDDAVVEGANRENFQTVDVREAIPVVKDREIAHVVGAGQQHPLQKQFVNPTLRAEEQTSVPEDQKTTAEKNTELSDETTAAKQTKVAEAESALEEHHQEDADNAEDNTDHVIAEVETKAPEVTTVEVVDA